jgi:HEAT repeat protein
MDPMGDLRDRILSRIDPGSRPIAKRDLDRLEMLKIETVEAALGFAEDPTNAAEDRSIAIWYIGQAHLPGATQILIGLLESESSESIVWELCKAIVVSTLPADRQQASSCLEGLLETSPDNNRRSAIVFALGLLGQQSAIPALSQMLYADEALMRLRELAAEALGNLASSAAATVLLESLGESPFALTIATVRALAATADSRLAPEIEELVAEAGVLVDEARNALEQAKLRDTNEETPEI